MSAVVLASVGSSFAHAVSTGPFVLAPADRRHRRPGVVPLALRAAARARATSPT